MVGAAGSGWEHRECQRMTTSLIRMLSLPPLSKHKLLFLVPCLASATTNKPKRLRGKGNGDDWAAFVLKLNNKARLVGFSNESRKCFCDLDAFVVVCTRILGIFFDSCLLA